MQGHDMKLKPLLIAALAFASPALAQQQRLSFIRDAEVENTIRTYGAPVFVAAGLNPSDIRIHLVNDTTLNAFVANGLNMFMNTGLASIDLRMSPSSLDGTRIRMPLISSGVRTNLSREAITFGPVDQRPRTFTP